MICQDKLAPQTVDAVQSWGSERLHLSFAFFTYPALGIVLKKRNTGLFGNFKCPALCFFDVYLVSCFPQQLDSLLDPSDHAGGGGKDPVFCVVPNLDTILRRLRSLWPFDPIHVGPGDGGFFGQNTCQALR